MLKKSERSLEGHHRVTEILKPDLYSRLAGYAASLPPLAAWAILAHSEHISSDLPHFVPERCIPSTREAWLAGGPGRHYPDQNIDG